MMQLKEHGQKPDLIFLFSLVALILLGVSLVYSATADDGNDLWVKQTVYFGIGALISFSLSKLNPRVFSGAAVPFYIVVLLGLIYVALGGGRSSHGAGRWIGVGSFHIQPSEFAKIAYMLLLAKILANRSLSLNRLRDFILPFVVFIIPFLLILKQPDLSTAMVFMAITLASFYWSGMSIAEIFILISPGLSIIATVNQTIWGVLMLLVTGMLIKLRIRLQLLFVVILLNMSMGYASFTVWNSVLKEHQRSRILTFIDPMRDPKGAGYQVIQSKVAIGSGGLFGKGYGQGSQTNLNFLPEEHTDFIFSVLGEQFGFAGAAITLSLFFLFISRAIAITTVHSNSFLNLVVVGSTTIFLFHVIVNIAMTLGMMPVTGLPLPFLSYGGSFVLTCMILVGILQSMRLQGHRI